MNRLIAVDWGTSNRRIYLIEDGMVTVRRCDDRGVAAMTRNGFATEVIRLRTEFGDAPVLLAGMVGSTRGWIDTGYVPCRATIADVAAGVVRPAEGIAILPGVCLPDGDVMRGEEVQLLGAVAAGLAPGNGLLCQPGTHAKWARMQDGAIATFTTAMTGEMYALLARHALIGAAMISPASDGAAFRNGLAEAANGDLLARLFRVRAASVLGLRADHDAASYVSGLLIGTDVAARLDGKSGEHVHLLADDRLGPLYAAAIEVRGSTATRVDSETAFVAGITQIWDKVR